MRCNAIAASAAESPSIGAMEFRKATNSVSAAASLCRIRYAVPRKPADHGLLKRRLRSRTLSGWRCSRKIRATLNIAHHGRSGPSDWYSFAACS